MSPLHARLAALRRRLWLVVTFRGVCWLLTVLLGTAVVAGWLDWRVPNHLPSLVRAFILAGGLAGGGYVAYRYLFRPLWLRPDDLGLALRIEQAFPALNDSLASTVQFLEQPDDSERSGSSSLRRVAVRKTMQQIESCDFNQVVNTRDLGPAGLSVAVAGGLAIALVLLAPALAWTALVRLADPFGGNDWPRQTHLEITPFRSEVGRGGPFEISGRVSGVVPEQATVEFAGLSPSPQTCPVLRGKDPGSGSFAVRLERVERSFRFQVRAGDAASDWFAVAVLPPPLLVPLEGRPSPQVSLHYPAYTDLEDQDLPDGSGNIEAVAGTLATLRAATDRRVEPARTWIEYRPEQPLARPAAFLGPLGATHFWASLALAAAGQDVWARFPVQVDSTGRLLSAAFLPRLGGMYALHLEDEGGLESTRLFDLRVQADPAPAVNLERPSPGHDSLDVLPSAEITLQASAEDQQYALRSVFLEIRCKAAGEPVRREDEEQPTAPGDAPPEEAQQDPRAVNPGTRQAVPNEDSPRRLPLYEGKTMSVALLQVLATTSAVSLAPQTLPAACCLHVAATCSSDADLHLRPQRLQLGRRLALAQLKRSDGSDLKQGDVLILQACADDFDDVTFEKKAGRSHEVELRIVGPAVLEKALNRAQAQVHQDLLRLHKMQQEALKHVIGAEQEWRNTGRLRPQDVDELIQAEQLQQQIRARIGSPPASRAEKGAEVGGLRAEVARILQTLRDNHLPRSGAQDRMETVADELERVAREELEQIEDRLTNARKENETATQPTRPAKGAKGQIGEARRHQEEVESTLNDLLKLLEPWGRIKDIKGEAKNILQEQRKLTQGTQELAKENQGQDRKELAPEQQAALDTAAELQNKLAERTEDLLQKMKRVGEDREGKDPEAARALKDAAQKGKSASGQMKEAAQDVRDNKVSNAAEGQRKSEKTLEDVNQALEEQREKELDRLRKKMKAVEERLADLAQRQDELSKKAKEAAELPDAKKREEALKRLARPQEKLQKEAQEMLRELTRLRANRAARELSGAENSMERAARQMQDGQNSEDPQDEALDRLKEAQRRLKQAQDEVEEELAREKLAKVADQVKALKARQEAIIAEGERIQQMLLQKKAWDRVLQGSLVQQKSSQEGLGQETKSLAEGRLAGARVFTHLLGKAAQAMEEAAQRLEERKNKAGERLDDVADDPRVPELQHEAVRRLGQLLDALKPEKGLSQRASGQGGGGRSGKGGDDIPPLAQLKALRALQEEVNERTAAFGKRHPDPSQLKEAEQRELARLRTEQQEIAELLDELTKPTEPEKGL